MSVYKYCQKLTLVHNHTSTSDTDMCRQYCKDQRRTDRRRSVGNYFLSCYPVWVDKLGNDEANACSSQVGIPVFSGHLTSLLMN